MSRLDVDTAGVASVVEEPTLTPHQFPRGASPGTFLHSLFEGLDLIQLVDPNWVREELELSGFESQWEPVLTEWITTVLQASLSEAGVGLSQLSARNRQVEIEFYLSISKPPIVNQLDTLIRQFDPLSVGCPPLGLMQVRDMLKGSISLVFRHEERYYLFDYKSNWLGGDSPAYTQQAMATTMQVYRYDLQYQLYILALYCYLRYRIADYDYGHHFGGVIYLSLRSADREHPQQGIYTTRPNVGLIILVDEMLTGMTLEKA